MNSKNPSSARPFFRNPPSVHSTPDEPSPAPSSYTDATPILSPMSSDQPDSPCPVNEELENELDNFITLQQQLQNPNTLTIHHLSQSITSSKSSNPAATIEETRAHRVFKRKHPNTPMFPNADLLECFPFTHSTLILKNFYKFTYHTSHNTLNTRPLTTINELSLTNIPYFPQFHGHHTTFH